ncbi:GDSL-type esterase/lipase family protein [Actinoplanes sp. NPDC089786]|uniref:SGNH/GDSL hydrolase family protein n=1 Tax=Actinoplanes sp. NPDC089786 TaxID=3155185 RepID=UPI003423671E
MTSTHGPTDDERRNFVRYTHTRNWPMLRRFPVTDDLHDDLLAQMLRCSVPAVRSIVDTFAAQVRETAAEMLADAAFRDLLRALPFRPEDRVVAIGDSITADRIGWFEILSAAVTPAGAEAPTMINLGVSGNTTADVIERFDLLEAGRPTRVLLMLGTNDVRVHGRAAGHRMATGPETERNLRVLLDLITGLGAATTVITPPAADQRRIDDFFAGDPVWWRASDIAEVAEIVRKVDPAGLDLHAATRGADVGSFLEADGVHPAPAGQRLILTHVVSHLAAE